MCQVNSTPVMMQVSCHYMSQVNSTPVMTHDAGQWSLCICGMSKLPTGHDAGQWLLYLPGQLGHDLLRSMGRSKKKYWLEVGRAKCQTTPNSLDYRKKTFINI